MSRVVKVVLSAQVMGYVDAMKQAASATKDVHDAGVSTAPALTGAFSKVRSGAAEMTREVKTAASTHRAEWGRVAGSMVLVGGAVTAVGAAALKTGIAYNTLQQQSRAALTTLLGSAQAANEQMDKLDAFARTSPFSKATFISAQQQMLAFGIETKKVIPYLDAVQNAVAASGGSNADIAGLVATMSKIKSSAKLTAQDLMEFGNRGVDAAGLIGAAMGKTGAQIREEITAGSLDADAALDALTEGMERKFGGAADNVKQTFSGAVDRVQAAWRDFSSELAKPLVDPNGGGALVDLLNWTADAMRGFQAMPEPVKTASTSIVGAFGVGSLAFGSMMLLVPKIVETREAFKTLSDVMPRTSGALSTVGRAGGGALAGMVAAAAGAEILIQLLKDMGPDAGTVANKVKTAADAVDLLNGATARVGDTASKLSTAGLERLGDILDNGVSGVADLVGNDTLTNLTRLGQALGDLAGSDLPSAQRQFRLLAESAQLTDAQQLKLLDKMPTLKAALVEQATATGVAADDTTLLKLAMGNALPVAQDNAKALREIAGQADDATGAVDALAGAIRGFGSATLDSREAQRQFEEAIDRVDEGLQRQQEAYIDANGSLDGFVATLDIGTDAGRENAANLDAIAEAANRAAGAIYETTGSEEEATAVLQRGRDELIAKAAQFGLTGEAAELYADSVIADMEAVKKAVDEIPPGKEIKVTADTNPATWEIDRFMSLRRTITVGVVASFPSSSPQNWSISDNAAGAIWRDGVKEFAAGAFLPGIYPATPGGIHRIAEAGFDEAYITTDPKYRDRSVGILQEMAGRLGVGVSQDVSVSLDGASITGTLELTGDGLARLVDARISGYDKSQKQAAARGYAGGL